MQQTNSTPLWRELNERRTQGEWKAEEHRPDMPKWWGNITAFLGKNESGIMNIETISCQIPRHGREKAKANAQYTVLAVNNLHKLAEALTRIREASLQGLEMYANGEKFSFETLAGYVAEISGETLAAIS